MDDLSRRIANLSPAKRALLELRLKKAETGLANSQTITPQVDRQVEKITARVSFAQQRLWFLNQLEPESASYNVPRAIRMTGTLNLQALEQSLNEIIRRHEPSLRVSAWCWCCWSACCFFASRQAPRLIPLILLIGVSVRVRD